MTTLVSVTSSQNLINSSPNWKIATWEEYIAYRDDPNPEKIRLYFNENYLLVEMGTEGISHSSVSELFTMLFYIWFAQNPEQIFSLFGGALLEKPKKKAAAPDIVLYLGADYPRWQPEERRYINLEKCRVPDLVGEISDTTLANDLDEKKHIYADLCIPEYWVIDVKARRIFAFSLQEDGVYEEITESVALAGFPIQLLEQTLERLNQETNGSAAIWFAQQIKNKN